MALLIKWDLEILEVAQVFPDHLKENPCHAAQQDFIPVHPFPQNALRNAKQITEEIAGSQGPFRISSLPSWYSSTSYLILNRNQRQKAINQ